MVGDTSSFKGKIAVYEVKRLTINVISYCLILMEVLIMLRKKYSVVTVTHPDSLH